jgi:hypothetical protein
MLSKNVSSEESDSDSERCSLDPNQDEELIISSSKSKYEVKDTVSKKMSDFLKDSEILDLLQSADLAGKARKLELEPDCDFLSLQSVLYCNISMNAFDESLISHVTSDNDDLLLSSVAFSSSGVIHVSNVDEGNFFFLRWVCIMTMKLDAVTMNVTDKDSNSATGCGTPCR